MNRNNIKYYSNSAMKNIILLFISGGIIQTFFHEIGFSVSQISTYTALTSGIQTIIVILNIFIADKVKNVRKLSALLNLSPIIFCTAMLMFCFGNTETNTAFNLALFLCIVLNSFQGINSILSYRLPYTVLDMRNFAKTENTSLIISGICSISVSFLITTFAATYNYRSIMLVGFIGSILFSVISSLCVFSMKENKIPESSSANEIAFSKLKKKVFVYFYIPNFIRGLSMGVINVIPVICINSITSNQSFVSGLVTIFSISSITGGLLYNANRKKLSTSKIYFYSGVAMLVLMPIMLAGKSPFVFGTIYLFVGVFYNIANNSAAIYATEIIDYYDMGTFTSSRLVLMSLGQTVAGAAVSAAIGKVPTVLILAAGGLMQFLSGYFTWLWEVRFSKNIK